MAISLNGGTGEITGVSVGGLPDGIVDTDMLADDAVTDAKQSLSGAAKAWVNFDGTGTVAINDSFNVSSITDNGTGDYTINFSTAMSNANYAYSCSRDRTGSQNGGIVMRTIATGTIRVLSFQENFASQDVDGAAVVVFGG